MYFRESKKRQAMRRLKADALALAKAELED